MISNILVDIGNTHTKWKFEGEYYILPTEKFDFKRLPESSKIWVSNVSNKSFNVSSNSVIFVNSQEIYKTLINAYSEPMSLGSDRWLGMIASYELSEGESFVLIDIGTAITVDIVNNFGTHLGGLIFPGLDKLRQTFNNFPVSSKGYTNKLGKSTEKAWSNGTLSLIVNTINQKINEKKNETPNISIFITGGGYQLLQSSLNFSHKYYENLVIDGLEYYAKYMG